MSRASETQHLPTNRRALLGGLGSAFLLPRAAFAAPKPKAPGAVGALLLPLSGERGRLGASMARAAALALPGDATPKLLPSYDTLGTPAGATAATRAALRKGTPLLLGPLTADEVKPVVDAAGGVPVLAFSNDEGLRGGGAFLLGITASQLVSAILGYARRRGVKRVALLAGSDGWATQCGAAARRAATAIGIGLIEVASIADRAAPATLAALRGGGGDAPDAVLLPDPDQLTADLAATLREAGIQPLGLLQALDYAPAGLAALAGAWLAAPDPAAFGDFAARYESIHGSAPGLIAALAYDAATIALAIAASGQPARQALLAGGGFTGVTGALRFRTDGSASRGLAILTVADGAYRTVDTSVGA